MKFFPLEKYSLVSPQKPEPLIKKLEAVVNTSGGGTLISYAKDNKSYRGKISSTSFEISRIIGYRNSFRPVIKGEVSGGYPGSEIKIYMRMHKAVIIFCCVWIGAVMLIAVAGIMKQVPSGSLSYPGLLPFVMLLLVYGLVMGGFKYESLKSRKFLKELFDAEEA